ncbi:MAG TPA: translocation/assembly module TamB domain-containing protein [Vicinamibacterales bacterium]|nr:translocation/assembly module TamB domain-containing protein [Vicinamibacterales bacterium]
MLAAALVIALLALALVETGWAKNLIRDLIVRQANEYLTATLSIGRLEGSLLRGLQLGEISLGRGGHTLIRIDEVALTYSIRELFQHGVVIRSVRLTRPEVVGAKMPDGRWDLGALVKRESREQNRTGPNRPIEIQTIEVIDGRISLQDPLDFGPAHVPTDFQRLNARFSFVYVPVRWTLNFSNVSWVGHVPDLSVSPLTGRFGRGPHGWFFEGFTVQTARSAYTLDGTINTELNPTVLDLRVRAPRFAFQEWAGVIRGLKNIAVDASFDTSLKGPVNKLATDLQLSGTGGGVKGQLTLDTSVPGWHGTGGVDLSRLNLARWLNRDDRPSDITGHVTFDLALELGRHFPRGIYAFQGPHAMYMKYEADQVRARGQLTATQVLVADASATAYGAAVTTHDSTIGIDRPFPFRFQGRTTGIDLRRIPASIPVPRVESLLTFDYDVTGRFAEAFIAGRATFAPSSFLGASVGDGTVGSIDTQTKPVRYAGDGEIDGINLRRFGVGLDVGWLQQPRYAGTMSGHFHVEGAGTSIATLTLTGGGHLARAEMFKGTLSDAEVSIAIAGGTLRASYDGLMAAIDPSIPFAEPRLEASLNGKGTVTATVRDLLTRTTALADWDVTGSLTLDRSRLRDLQLDAGSVEASLKNSELNVARLALGGPAIDGHGSGTVALTDEGASDFSYEVTRAELASLQSLTGQSASGTISTAGRINGPWTALRAAGDASVAQLEAGDFHALTMTGHYDVTVPSGEAARATARLSGRGEFLTVFGQALQQSSGTVTYDARQLGFDLALKQQEARDGRLAGTVALRPELREASLLDLTITLGRLPWRLAAATPPPVVSWTDEQIAVTPLAFVAGDGDQRLGVDGTWRRDGKGALRLTASHVFLDTLQAAFERPTRYGGVVDLEATIRGTRQQPEASGTLTVANGRVERVSYQKLQATFSYRETRFDLDARLDQAPGVWVTAVGQVPLGLLTDDGAEQPIDLALKSSTISLGLLEGVTDVVRNVSGTVTLDVKVIGTNRDPHLDGRVAIADAGFLVVPTGSTYKNARAALTLASERLTVDSLHIEDAGGRPLDVHGSLGTHELRVSELQIEGTARRFEVMHNELGQVSVDATVKLQGRYESPRIAGDVTITSGTLRVDEILSRALFQPYSTEATRITEVDAVAALNPWDRLGLDLSLHVPATLRLTGDSVQISQGTPIGLGDINLRVSGDLYLYKDPAQPLSVTGSFDQITGTYAFQGRGFNMLGSSSINFRGDLNPEIYVTVTRVISGVETRVSIFGPLRSPELRLASTPTLDPSDILSLIVFNTSTNQLSASQQQQLVARAGVLAAGFLAQPLVAAISSETGIDMFAVEPGDVGSDVKITIGREIAPGLVARFSREFGQEAYDEATIEYTLSRLFRIRATFSDAQTLTSSALFRRVERAGIDLLLYFSF